MKHTLFIFLISSVLFACQKNPLKVDVSEIDVSMQIERFDKELFELKNTTEIDSSLLRLAKKYQPFFDNFTHYVIRLGKYTEPTFQTQLNKFLTDTIISQLYDTCLRVFLTMKPLEDEITTAFRYYKYYFPKKNIPRILTHISGFNESIIVDVGIISVGIDKYLGSDHMFYRRLGFYNYQRKKMNPSQIPLDVFLAIGKSEIPSGKQKTLLDYMIFHGKVYYFLQAMFPCKAERELLGYSVKQQTWCKANEARMWQYLAEQKHLFSTDKNIINRYIQDGPFTKGFPEGSPAQTGSWLGLQIVKSYMKIPDTELPIMLRIVDYELFLRKSGYKPS